MKTPFSICPVEMFSDKRLSLEDIRVLGAILSFRRKNTDVAFPSRAEIAGLTRMHVSNISAATSRLVKLGWMIKEGKGGYSRSTRYTITPPDLEQIETVAESATVAHSATVADSATGPLADSATPPLADSATRKEQRSEQRSEQEKGRASARPASTPVREGKKKPLITFDEYSEQQKAAGKKLIAEDDPVFIWTEGAGIPDEWLHLAWVEFANRHRGQPKRYADWPHAFRNAVRNNWFDLWRITPDGALTLTPKGELARRVSSRPRMQEVAA